MPLAENTGAKCLFCGRPKSYISTKAYEKGCKEGHLHAECRQMYKQTNKKVK